MTDQSIRRVRRAGLPLIAVWCAGCSIVMHIPINRFDTPEVRGELGRGRVDLGLAPKNSEVIVPDYSHVPPVTGSRSFNDSLKVGAQGRVTVGLATRMDVSLRVAAPGPTLLQFKYQLMGAPELVAKRGNRSLALTAGFGGSRQKGEYTKSGVGGSTGAWNLHTGAADLAVIGGYRLRDNVLAYGGSFYTAINYDGAVEQTTVDLTRYPFSGKAHQGGVNAGFRLSRSWAVLTLEGAWSRVTDQSASSPERSSAITLGAQVGIRY